jgi:hypothetical protein
MYREFQPGGTMRAAILVLALAACGVEREDYPKVYAKATCAKLYKCDRGNFENAYSSMGDCRADWERLADDIADAFDLFGEYDPGVAGKCVRAIRSASCDEFDNGDYDAACNDVWGGDSGS